MAGPRRQLMLGTFVHSKTRRELEYLHDAAVGVDGDGRIAGIETAAGDAAAGDAAAAGQRLLGRLGWGAGEVDVCACGPGQFFFPGFIDTHVHAAQYPNVGLFGKTTLLEWLARYTFPLEASLGDVGKARRVYRACVRRTLAHGTTTAAYFATIDVAATNALADVCLALGQRALVGRVCMDAAATSPEWYRDESADEALRATAETIAHIGRVDPGHELVAPILTPRFAPSCSREAMLGLARLQREQGLAVQTHLSENGDEMALVRRLFPEAASYADVYERHGLLTPRTIVAHAIHISDAEARLLAARGTKVAHCPCSNSSLASGQARVRWLWERGVDVGLGTDMSGGYSASVLEAARQAVLVSRHLAMRGDGGGDGDGGGGAASKLTVDEALYLATRGGAAVVGLADKVGGFDVGKQWDAQLVGLGAVVDEAEPEPEPEPEGEAPGGEARRPSARPWVDGGNVDLFGWETWDERIAKWLFTGDDRNTKKVWVRGRLVHARP